MSTRAMYTFTDETGSYHVYKHSDGYPTGAAEALVNALSYAWPLPRFEADEFAAAFVAGNKSQGGGVYLMRSGDWQEVANHDLEYRYTIGQTKAGTVLVTCYRVSHVGETTYRWNAKLQSFKAVKVPKAKQGWQETKLFTAPLKTGATLRKIAAETEKADA